MTAAEPLDPETTEPAEWEPWDDEDWLLALDWTDDDGSAEAGRYRRVHTIDMRSELL